jgi:hypothetical protein
MSKTELLVRIGGQLVGIDYDACTHTERKIVDLLAKEKYLEVKNGIISYTWRKK